MDKAPAYGAGDSGFESRYGLFFFQGCKKIQATGFEPVPLSRLAPKASALTTRPSLRSKKLPQAGLEPATPRLEVWCSIH